MAREYVPIFFDWLDVTQDLTAEEKGNLIDAVVAYASGKEYEHLLSGGCRIAFRFLKGQVDRNNAISDARSEARKNKPEQNTTNDNKPEQNTTKSPKEKDKEKEKEKENDKEKDSKPQKRFEPPTLEEVSAYCKERGNGIDPEYFIAYNENRNWTLSNGKKMKDWKLAIVTWEKNNFTRPKSKTVAAQEYEQRNYSGEQEEAMRRMIEQMHTAGGVIKWTFAASANTQSNGTRIHAIA